MRYLCDMVQTGQSALSPPSEYADKLQKLISQWKEAKAADKKDFSDLSKQISNLFYGIENNGDPQDHASKLQYLFQTPRIAANWLHYYSQHTDNQQPLHHLCTHIDMHIGKEEMSLPLLWKFGEGNVKYFFSNLTALSLITKYYMILHDKIGEDKLKTTSSFDFVRVIQEELQKTELKMIGLEPDILIHKEMMWLEQITRINLRFKRSKYENAKEIIMLLHESKSSDKNLPPICMKSETIGLKAGYYFVKLYDDDPRTAMAGFLTECCQRVGGQGEPCVRHSISSEFGASYAIMKGRISPTKETLVNYTHDALIVISWAWASLDPMNKTVRDIGFDSIEFGKDANELEGISPEGQHLDSDEIINVFYTEAAQRFLQEMPYVQKVIVGTHGQTPEIIGHNPISLEGHALPRPWIDTNTQYKGYSDSRSQVILASRVHGRYYQMHELNYIPKILILLSQGNPDVLLALALNYAEEIAALHKPIPEIPAWISLFNQGKLSEGLAALSAETINLSIYLAEKEMTVLMFIVTQFQTGIKIPPSLFANIQAEDLNVGSSESTALIAATDNKSIPMEVLEWLLEKGGDPNMGDSYGQSFVHHLFNLREYSTIPLEWIERFHFNMKLPDDNNVIPLQYYLKASSIDYCEEKNLDQAKKILHPYLISIMSDDNELSKKPLCALATLWDNIADSALIAHEDYKRLEEILRLLIPRIETSDDLHTVLSIFYKPRKAHSMAHSSNIKYTLLQRTLPLMIEKMTTLKFSSRKLDKKVFLVLLENIPLSDWEKIMNYFQLTNDYQSLEFKLSLLYDTKKTPDDIIQIINFLPEKERIEYIKKFPGGNLYRFTEEDFQKIIMGLQLHKNEKNLFIRYLRYHFSIYGSQDFIGDIEDTIYHSIRALFFTRNSLSTFSYFFMSKEEKFAAQIYKQLDRWDYPEQSNYQKIAAVLTQNLDTIEREFDSTQRSPRWRATRLEKELMRAINVLEQKMNGKPEIYYDSYTGRNKPIFRR